jgi:hypothetical protein
MKTDHADLLNTLDHMASTPLYILRRKVLRDAEQLIIQQEQRIKALEALVTDTHNAIKKETS